MGLRLRVSAHSLKVLESLLEQAAQGRHGYSLCRQTQLSSGTHYRILLRRETLAWLETRGEEPGNVGRPPRHLYRLTGQGRARATEELCVARAEKSWKPAYTRA